MKIFSSSIWQISIDRMLQNLSIGSIKVTYPNNEKKIYKGKISGPIADVTFHTHKSIKNTILGGSIGFCEAVISGEISSKSLQKIAEIGASNESGLDTNGKGYKVFKLFNKFSHLFRNNSIKGAKRNISLHYDLGNDFYSYWLDETMTYSSAIFTKNNSHLKNAQLNKYDTIAKAVNIQKGEKILEIGCGWGGFLEFASKQYEAFVTSITVSKKQYEYTKNKIKQTNPKINPKVLLEDYRNIKGKFDKIVSIEMFEAVGENYWPIFFQQIKNLLKPNGAAALQVITINDEYFQNYRRYPDFIQKYIFPGGMLPSISSLEEPISNAGLKLISVKGFGKDYANTLAIWRKRFNQAWPEISKLGFDQKFKRMWNLYLCYCEGGFRAGSIDVNHLKIIPIK